MDRKILGLLLGLAAPAALGCVKKPYQAGQCDRPDLSGCVIEDLNIVGNHALGDGEIEEKIATAETSHVLGGVVKDVPVLSLWDRLTVDYERLDPFVLQRDLARIERYYRARGYYEAHVHAGRVIRRPDKTVQVEIAVDEGLPMQIGKVDLEWKDWALPVAQKVTPAVKDAAASLKPGALFEEDAFEDTKKKILRAMTDRGFAYAKVEGKASVDLSRHEARIVYTLELGPRSVFGDIRIEGQGELPTAPLLAALQIKKGDEFSTAALNSAEIALGELGLFGSIDVDPQLSPSAEPQNPVIPVVFRVQPAALRAVKLGVGGEIGGRVEAHGLAGWEHRNLFGGLRKFSVELSPALSFYPKTFNTLFDGQTVSFLPEVKLRASLAQPGVLVPLDARTRGLVSGSFSVYRLPTAEAIATDIVVGYVEVAGTAGLERSFWDSHVSVGLYGNLQFDYPFAYGDQRPPDEYANVFIPSVRATAALDFRHSEAKKIDPVNPHSGFFLFNDIQFGFFDTQDLRLRPEIRGYVPLSRRVTLALRLVGGFLFPFNGYTDAIRDIGGHEDDDEACRDFQLLQFRAFFSGGANSNRGYAYNGVGPHEVTCLSKKSAARPTGTLIATGGSRLWESSVELRFPIQGKLGSVLFVDASDVTRQELRICAPHLSAGLGLRYDTPVGPVRADIGYRIPGAQVIQSKTGCPLGILEEGVQNTLLGQPIAISVAIGEAF